MAGDAQGIFAASASRSVAEPGRAQAAAGG